MKGSGKFIIIINPIMPLCSVYLAVRPVGVPRHVFIDALDADLQTGAAVAQHVAQVPLQTVVRARLYGDAHTLGVAALRVPAKR